jgi:hypothetical protein
VADHDEPQPALGPQGREQVDDRRGGTRVERGRDLVALLAVAAVLSYLRFARGLVERRALAGVG